MCGIVALSTDPGCMNDLQDYQQFDILEAALLQMKLDLQTVLKNNK